jgi:hypothetical protein
VNATIANAVVYYADCAGAGVLLIDLAGHDTGPDTSKGTLTFTKPAKAPDPNLLSSISLPAAPAPGTYTDTMTGVCGGVTIATNGGNSATGVDWVASAACPNFSMPIGAWTLNLTSAVKQPPITGYSGETFYTVHGSLTATMSDGTALNDTAMLDLTF